MIRDQLRITDGDCLGHGVHRLSGKFLGNIKRAACAALVAAAVVVCQRRSTRPLPLLPLTRRRANARKSSLSASTGALFCSRFSQCLDKNGQNVAGGNVLQIPGDRLCKLNVGIEFVDQLPDKRHVDRSCHDMDAVRADIGSNFNFSHDHRFFGKNTAAALNRHRLWHTSRHLYAPNTRLARCLSALLENVLEHVDDFAGIGAIELDELTHHFRRRHVYLLNHPGKLPNNVSVLCHKQAGGFWQRQNVDRARAPLKIRHQNLLKFLWVGVLQPEQKADYGISHRNVGQVRDDRNRRFARILAGADDINNVTAHRNE